MPRTSNGVLRAVTIRTTCVSEEVDASYLRWLQGYSPAHFVVKHNADEDDVNPHWHAIIWSRATERSIREALVYAVPAMREHRGRYSVKAIKDTPEDLDIFERYMCHGAFHGDAVVVVSAQAPVHHPDTGAYTSEWCRQKHEAFWVARREFVVQRRGRGKMTTIEEIMEEVRLQPERTSVGDIITATIAVYKRHHKMMNVFNMRAQVRTVTAILQGPRGDQKVYDEIAQGLEGYEDIILDVVRQEPSSTPEYDPLD